MSNNRERNEEGQYVGTLTDDNVLAVLRDAEDPVLSAKEVSERMDCSAEAARQRLHDLKDSGMVKTKTVGARARIWWLVES
ncbi:response regulator of citrate/malate metabolism [Halobacteriales archaeon SW_8_68_21]|nr:MAG: response regulator of citrate/malate metabolism [Halobacteriales archaeon SW_8_68_21]